MHKIFFIRISGEITKIKDVFHPYLGAGFLAHHLVIIFNYLHNTASYSAVAKYRNINHLSVLS